MGMYGQQVFQLLALERLAFTPSHPVAMGRTKMSGDSKKLLGPQPRAARMEKKLERTLRRQFLE